MKILKFNAENVKKLKVVEITPSGHIVQITGANGQGKTSVLDAIWYAFTGTANIPSKPVRKGAETAKVRLDLGELVVTRRFTESGTTLIVEAANGARFPSPQKMLDDLVGSLSFDPLAFTRRKSTEQLETLRSMVKLDVDVDALDAENKTDYDARTEKNRSAKQIEAQIMSINVPDGTPAEPLDIDDMITELTDAGNHNSNVERQKTDRSTATNSSKNYAEAATRARFDADRLEVVAENEAHDLEKRAAKIRKDAEEKAAKLRADAENHDKESQRHAERAAEPVGELIDTDAIRQKVNAARVTNKNVDAKKLRDSRRADLEAIRDDVSRLNSAIEGRTKTRRDAIASAVMPVEGLSFGEGEILFDGLPFDQASDADRIRVSVAIAMAGNPKLRVLRIRDGSLLDEKTLALVAKMAEEGDYQVWIEQVDTSGKVGIYLEDGEVKAANA